MTECNVHTRHFHQHFTDLGMEAREEKEDASPCRNFLKNVKMILQVTIAVFYLTLLESEKPSLVGLAWLG